MKIIFYLAFLLLFQMFSSCEQAVKVPQSSALTDSMQMQKSNMAGIANIVFKSTDGGQTWHNISKGLPEPLKDDYGIGNSVLFADDNWLWLTIGKDLFHAKTTADTTLWEKATSLGKHSSVALSNTGLYTYNYGGGGIFHKTNGTDVWLPVFTNFQEKRILSIFETAGGTVFIGSDRGLFKSGNSGKSWKQLPVGGGGKIVESNGILLATSDAGILRSADDGENWALVISEGGVGIDVARIEGGFGAINYSTASKTRRIRTSYDGGNTWQTIDAGLQAPGVTYQVLPPVNANHSAQSISDSTSHPVDSGVPAIPMYITTIIQVGENFFCGRSDGIYKSSDNGKKWQCVRCVEEGKMFKLYVFGNVIYAIQTESHC